MALVSLQEVTIGFGGPLLFEQINMQIEPGERICLLGRNGAGKSTLMRLISGEVVPDGGEIVRRQGARIALLPQEVPRDLNGTVSEVVTGGSSRSDHTDQVPDTEEGWRVHRQAEQVISRMKLDPHARFHALSAGMKRRVLLARGLMCDPDLLLLDEPTNHLDIEAIDQLEEFLLRYGGTLIFVTHDRMFLRKLATRIVEIDRGSLIDWSCDYDTFLKRKEAALEAEGQQWSVFDKKLAQEEIWIRRGIKARRTRNEGRVRALEKMREARRARREHTGTVRMQVQETERSGKRVIEAKGVHYGYDDCPVVRNFSTTILRGDRVGIIGPNGSGKTTLLRVLLGELTPQQGEVRHGTHFQVAYFDQLRARLDEEKSVQDNVGEGNDTVLINGKPRHIIGYLKDFLFSPERARSPLRVLSGGERNRLLLAKLFTKPSNVLVMDEPTNDLDVETLELLEELLVDYPGTLLLVSHDRTFLNNVVTSTLAFEGKGQVNEYVGGYDDWIRQHKAETPAKPEKNSVKAERPHTPTPQREGPRKLSYKEQRELESLPERIEALEAEQQYLYRIMADPSFYQGSGSEIVKAKSRLEALEKELEEAYQRWEILDT